MELPQHGIIRILIYRSIQKLGREEMRPLYPWSGNYFSNKASLPYLNEIPMSAISRFLREVKVMDLVGNKDPVAIQKAVDSCAGPKRSEAHIISMPEVDENSWRKYERLIKQNVMSRIKKG